MAGRSLRFNCSRCPESVPLLLGGRRIGKKKITRPIFDETVTELRKEVTVSANLQDRILPRSELIENLKDADGVITLVTDRVDREVLESSPRLKVIANFGVGFNN